MGTCIMQGSLHWNQALWYHRYVIPETLNVEDAVAFPMVCRLGKKMDNMNHGSNIENEDDLKGAPGYFMVNKVFEDY